MSRAENEEFILEIVGVKKITCPCCQEVTICLVKIQDDPEDFNKMMADTFFCAGCGSSAMQSNDKMVWH